MVRLTFTACLLSLCALTTVAADPPKPEQFLGRWSGAWDGKWKVQFTITQDPETKKLDALYEWEERKGQPLRSSKRPAKMDGNSLQIGVGIHITLSDTDPNKAHVKGHFLNNIKRSSDLERDKQIN